MASGGGFDDPAIAEALVELIDARVKLAVGQPPPKKRYGTVVSVNGDGTVNVQFADAVESSTGWAVGELVPDVGDLVRVLEWPGVDGDRYVDAVLGQVT